MSETWRCFVAVPIPEALREQLDASVAAWHDDTRLADLRWSDPAGWHLTIAFLGATAPDDVGGIARALREVGCTLSPFAAQGGGLGAFPSKREARVVWYGVDDEAGRLGDLAAAVCRAIGLEEPRRFRGHLTLARSRRRVGGPNLVEWLDSADAPSTPMVVDRLLLFRSHLGRGPARYEALAEAPLEALAAHG